jgi:hypothetical protein
MFEQLRKAFGLNNHPKASSQGVATPGQLALWAGAQRWDLPLKVSPIASCCRAGGRAPWRLESGAPHATTSKVPNCACVPNSHSAPDAHVMVINRALKEELEGRVYGAITDSLQTTVNQSLPQEMRWLSIYEELRWPQMPASFLRAFAVVGEDLDTARHWVNAALVSQLMRISSRYRLVRCRWC